MVDCAVDIFGGVLESDSKTVKTVALDVDVNVLVLVAAGNSRDNSHEDTEGRERHVAPGPNLDRSILHLS